MHPCSKRTANRDRCLTVARIQCADFRRFLDSLSLVFPSSTFTRSAKCQCVAYPYVRRFATLVFIQFWAMQNFDNKIRFARHMFDSAERQTDRILKFRSNIFN